MDTAAHTPVRTPLWIRLAAALLALGLGVTVIWGTPRALQAPLWPIGLGFEAVILASAVMGALVGLGRFRASVPLALLCVGGSGLIATMFGHLSSGVSVGATGIVGRLIAMMTDPLSGARLGVCAGILMLSALTVLGRRPTESTRRLVWAAATGAPVIIAAAAWMVPIVRSSVMSLPAVALAMLATLLGLLGIGLVSASVHFVIRAFEAGAEFPAGELRASAAQSTGRGGGQDDARGGDRNARPAASTAAAE